MTNDWGQTQGIRMSAQSVELQMIGHHGSPELFVTGSLMNIARGSCTLRLITSGPSGPNGIGHLKIEAMRPVMQAEVNVSQSQFEYLLQTFQGSLPRPATAIFKLKEELIRLMRAQQAFSAGSRMMQAETDIVKKFLT
jgi:hypothetical protein